MVLHVCDMREVCAVEPPASMYRRHQGDCVPVGVSCGLGPEIWSTSYERFTADDGVLARPSTTTAAIANTFEKRLHLIALLLGSGISHMTLSRK